MPKQELKFADSKVDQLTKEEMQQLYHLQKKFASQILSSSKPDFGVLNDISFVQYYLEHKCWDLYGSIIED